MPRWAETKDRGRRLTNDRDAACGSCGELLPPGQGRVWKCSGLACGDEGHRVPGPDGSPRGGWHCTCLDAAACRQRCTPPSTPGRALAASACEAWRRLQQAAEAPRWTEEEVARVERRADELCELMGVRSPEAEWADAASAWWTTATAEVDL